MSDHVRSTIDEVILKVQEKEAELLELKKMVNQLCGLVGEPARFELTAVASSRPKTRQLRPDQFFGKAPTTAAREFLEQVEEPKSAEEILEALESGGFDFEGQKWTETGRLRNLAISLGKNSAIFTRLPSGPFGLTKWYPDAKKKAEKKVAPPETKGSEPPREEDE